MAVPPLVDPKEGTKAEIAVSSTYRNRFSARSGKDAASALRDSSRTTCTSKEFVGSCGGRIAINVSSSMVLAATISVPNLNKASVELRLAQEMVISMPPDSGP